MTNTPNNPYANFSTPAPGPAPTELNIDPADLSKVKAIIKDANQFWIAILLCIFCTGLGALIIGPWYMIRLLQWNSMAGKHLALNASNPVVGSTTQKFQQAKIKLIIGLSFGAFMLLLLAALVVLNIVMASVP